MKIRDELREALSQSAKENEALRKRICEMEAKKRSTTELEIQNDPRWKQFQEENEEMKKKLSGAEDQYSSSRRTLRSAIPSDKALAAMSSETLRELSRRLKKHLSD